MPDSVFVAYGLTQLLVLGAGALVVLFVFNGLSQLGGFVKGAVLGVVIGVIARFGTGVDSLAILTSC
jgi:FtsH-binding integral membrane protein